jgi:hypothetical protein
MSIHATYTQDPDKAVCGVRISGKEGQQAATVLADLTCDRCILRVLRTLQKLDPTFDASKFAEVSWPAGLGGVPGVSW